MRVSKAALHPGQFLKYYLEELGMSQSALAERLGCTPTKINEIVNGKRGISADLALQLGEALQTSAEMWWNAQTQWELNEARKRREAG